MTRKYAGPLKKGSRSAYVKGSRKNTKFIKRAKSSGAQQKQLLSVQRQVTSLKSKVQDRAQYAQYKCPIQDGVGPQNMQIDLPIGQFYVNNLVKPNTWGSIFQTTNHAQNSNKCMIKGWDLQLVFSPKNSLTALTPKIIRCYVVSLRDETAQDTLNGTAGMTAAGLNGAANGLYYENTFVDGGLATMVKFNPASFKIHAYREFTVANIMQETAGVDPDTDVAVTNTFNALKRVRIHVKTNLKLKLATGIWKNMTEGEVMPKDRRYLIVYTGGWTDDGDNTVRMDCNIVSQTRVTN